jgi:hypothetical protein
MTIKFAGKQAPRRLDTVAELFNIDHEMNGYIVQLGSDEHFEPQALVDTTYRLHHLAVKRAALVDVINLFAS